MTPEHTTDSKLEDRLCEILAEFVEEADRGGVPDEEAYLARYPEFADDLRRCFANYKKFPPPSGGKAELALAGDGVTDEASGSALLETLGDFRIVREIGRGGMGVVYEAEQLSLRRRVALKVLPLAATMDPRHLQRFHNEARAAACLHHGHIVPVFYVGCERGVHFYAMQLIEGETLATVIRELRREQNEPEALATGKRRAPEAVAAPAGEDVPATVPHVHRPSAAAETPPRASLSTEGTRRGKEYYRKVAELGVQAAEALDYAHERGVIHRDVKPGNLMLDGHGALWVTDFGLAHLQHAEGSLTMTGDLVGTVRYMSPEQALAKRVVVDHRTDVYSLGATLYELLTLRPAFTGQDRQELLRQVAFEEPIAPRKLERGIPAELETIVLKAMEKSAADRYATAQEMADDLRHWLEDRPIKARRPSLRQVAARWVRRHRAVVWSAAVVAVLATLMGGGAGLVWVQKRAVAQGEAQDALEETRRLLAAEKWSEANSAMQRAQGVLAGIGANPELRAQIAELNKDLEMARRLTEARLQGARVKDGQFDTRAMCQDYAQAFMWYGLVVDNLEPQDAAERLRSSAIRMQLVAALDDWAWMWRDLKVPGWKELLATARIADPDATRNRLRDALERNDANVLKEWEDSALRDDLPPTTAMLLIRLSRETAVVKQVLAIMRQVQQRHSTDFWLNHELGVCSQAVRPPQLDDAIRYYSVAVALRPESPGAHVNLGIALRAKGRFEEAIGECRRAVELKRDYVEAYVHLGGALARNGQLDEAIEAYRHAIRLNPDFAPAHSDLGAALVPKGRFDEAIAECRLAIRLKPDYVPGPTNLGFALQEKGLPDEAIAAYREALRLNTESAISYNNLAICLAKNGRLREAIDTFRQGIRRDPGEAIIHSGLGGALKENGQLDEAIVACREAIRLKSDCFEAYSNLGNALCAKGRLDEAIEAHSEAVRINKRHADSQFNLGVALQMKGRLDDAIAAYREASRLDNNFAGPHYNLGIALNHMGRLDDAIAAFREAIRLNKADPAAHNELGLALAAKGQFNAAIAAYREAIRLNRDAPEYRNNLARVRKLVELEKRLPAVLQGKDQPKDASERVAFAVLCQQIFRQQYEASARFYQEALDADPNLPKRVDGLRYNAACAAALAGCGQGKDAAGLDEKVRARRRHQALDCLRADLDAWNEQLKNDPARFRPVIVQQMVRRVTVWLIPVKHRRK